MKKLLLVMTCLCLVGCGTKENKTEKGYCGDENATSCKIEANADMSAYENFTKKENQFIESDMSKVLSLFDKKESGIIYFGFPRCPWCVEALPIMDEVAKENNKNILYVQTRDKDKKLMFSEEDKTKIMSYCDDYLEKDEDGNKQFYVPFLIVVKEGKVVDGHIGTVDGYDTSVRKMNELEKAELKDIYQTMFDKS